MQRLLRGSLELVLLLAQGLEQRLPNRIVRRRKTSHPFRHDLHIAKITQCTEQRLAQLLHLFPCGIGIDGQEAVRHRTATANSDPEIMYRVGVKMLVGFVTLL